MKTNIPDTKIADLLTSTDLVAIKGKVVSIYGKFSVVLGEDVLRIVIKDETGSIELSPIWVSKDRCLNNIGVGDEVGVVGNKRDTDFFIDRFYSYIPSPETKAMLDKAKSDLDAQERQAKRILRNRKKK